MNHLIAFQKKHNLVPDGILGRITLLKFMEFYKLPSIEATAHFFGQIAHETWNFKYDEENLNYSSKALQTVFSKYFPTKELANKYARKPSCIANLVYANRMGNGDPQSGEGWLYRGRGAIMLTGKTNYELFSKAMDMDFVCYPNLVRTDYFFECALWYFNHRKLWSYCELVDIHNVRQLTRKINGGFNGLDHRYNLTINYHKLLL